MEDSTSIVQNEKSMEFQAEAIGYLDETRKWAMFLSIMGFIAVGLLIVAALVMGVIFSFIPDTDDLPAGFGLIFSVLYLVLAGLYFFPVLYLNQFSQKAKKAIAEQNSSFLTEAIGRLKSHYKFIGIMTIVMMAIYPVIIVIAVAVGVSSAM